MARRAAAENGKLDAINPLLRVLDELDKYGAVVEIVNTDYGGAHERLMAIVNGAAGRVLGPVPGESAATRAMRPDTPEPLDAARRKRPCRAQKFGNELFGFGSLVTP